MTTFAKYKEKLSDYMKKLTKNKILFNFWTEDKEDGSYQVSCDYFEFNKCSR